MATSTSSSSSSSSSTTTTTNQSLRDLQWLLITIKSESLNLHNISFFYSQPASNCHQETENSININISRDDASAFTELLTAFSASNTFKTCLRNLEFHKIEWESQQIRSLGDFLDSNLSLKQLAFRRNSLSRECMVELSEVLKRNKVIKELVFSESELGHVGAEALASALKANESLEELQIWEDSIGPKGSEELSKMIEVNTTLKLFTIFDSNSITATPLVSAVLARNRAMEVHIWSGENGEKSSNKVVEFVPENSTLRIYRIDVSGACRVACALGLNSTVKSLDLTGVRLKSRWAKEFRLVLEQNCTLKEVTLSKTCLKNKAVVYVAAGLFKNRGLESLSLDGNWFGGVGTEHLLCPLSRFSSLQCQANTTLKSLTFGGAKTKIGRDGLSAILHFLTTNETLTRLGIHDDESLRPDDFIKIFEGLKRNASLKRLSFQGCKGVRGEAVSDAIMEALRVNPFVEEIDFERTPMQGSGELADRIRRRLGQIEKSEPEVADTLKDMPLTVPKSCRVFLCGQEYAGKTTLCNSISQNFSASKLPYIDQVRTIVNPVEQAVRTVGMKIKTFKDEDTKISIWNLAGQHEFYALHDLMFPGHGSASFFFIVTSLFRKPSNREPKTPAEIEEDLRYWLRFIVSNSKRAVQQCLLPNVTIVLTHSDKTNQQSQSLQGSVEAIQNLREKFRGFVEFYQTVFTVDARSSASVSKLTHHLRRTCKTILQRVPRVHELCNELVRVLSDWRSENCNRPAMKWKEFCELCQVKVQSLRVQSRSDDTKGRVESRRRAVATCLHHIGEVIYFDELGFLILDCEWFCGEVLGQLMRLGARRQSSSGGGFISKQELEKILKGSLQTRIVPGLGSKVFESLESSDLVRMMLKLEVCYEQDPSDPSSLLLIPSMLEEGRGRAQRWEMSGLECVYVGRHLECDDSSHMFLTPGFFPRLQVNLHNKIMGLRSQHGATYSLEKYLISITINGMNVRVELGGQLGYYIDVLACSTRNVSETLKFIHQLIIPAIHALCGHGITLTESLIRPDCVKSLTPPRYRKTQSIPLNRLKSALLSVPAEGMYDYQHTWEEVVDPGSHQIVLKPGFDLARDLLSDEEIREVLHRRYHDLYNLAVELQVQPEEEQALSAANESSDTIDPSLGGIAKGLEVVLQRLKIIEQEIKDVRKEIQGLRYYEHRLLAELHRKVNYLVNFNIAIEERKFPNMFYFVETENYSRRLVTNVISGMRALRLHMLCEFRREMHVVEDQMGCEIMQVDNVAVKSLAPYMSKFMKLVTFALKIGAHLAVGMGEMIPDLSREVAHLAHSPLLYGAAAGAGAAGIAGAAAMGRAGGRTGRDIREEHGAAQQWVADFLRERRCSTGKDIAEKFGLYRIRYRDSGQIGWVCRRHLSLRAHEVVEVPI